MAWLGSTIEGHAAKPAIMLPGLSAHRTVIPMSEPDLGDAEMQAALQVLRSGRLSLGAIGPRFEQRFAEYVGSPHAVAVSGGTAALHLAIIAAGVSDGDLVITSPFSFVASANTILYERAVPIFVDVDANSGNVDAA